MTEQITQQRIFADNMWYAAGWEHEVAEADNKLARTICEVPLVFFAKESGGYVALDNRCCHRAAPLSIGRVEGDCIRCMYHGMLYNADGQVIEIPGQERISKSHKVRSYPVVVKGGMLWIWMGDPALANEDDIHDFPPLSEPENWQGFERRRYLHYAANWLLIVDNLADFSHVAFVHTNTLGAAEEYAYTTSVEDLDKLDNGFKLQRWHLNSPPAPFHKKVIPEAEHDRLLDRCNDVSMYLPGVFHMETIFAPAGYDREKDDRTGTRQYRNCQFMTPETRNTTHFFWDYMHDFDRDKPEVTRSLDASMMEGFLEDKLFIEEQQKLLVNSPDFVPLGIMADEAFVHFRKIWNKQLQAEDAANPLVIKENKRRIL